MDKKIGGRYIPTNGHNLHRPHWRSEVGGQKLDLRRGCPKNQFYAFDKQRGRARYIPSGRQQLSQQATHAHAFVGWLTSDCVKTRPELPP